MKEFHFNRRADFNIKIQDPTVNETKYLNLKMENSTLIAFELGQPNSISLSKSCRRDRM
jgi:hypothetical protein